MAVGGAWIKKDTGDGGESVAGYLPLPIGAPSDHGQQVEGALLHGRD